MVYLSAKGIQPSNKGLHCLLTCELLEFKDCIYSSLYLHRNSHLITYTMGTQKMFMIFYDLGYHNQEYVKIKFWVKYVILVRIFLQIKMLD